MHHNSGHKSDYLALPIFKASSLPHRNGSLWGEFNASRGLDRQEAAVPLSVSSFLLSSTALLLLLSDKPNLIVKTEDEEEKNEVKRNKLSV